MRFTPRALLRAFAFLSLCAIAHAGGNLKVNLSPSAAVSAGAQWRVDGGAWQASGATVKGLFAGTHNVEFKTVSGWLTPALINASITNGNTTTLSTTYAQAAALRVDLTPSTAQWRIDGGAWQASGATLANLPPGNHTIEYSTLAQPSWGTPATETIALSAGQSLVLTRSYLQLGQVMVALVPSTGTWRLAGGAWQASGASLWVQPGTYTLEYGPLEGYDPPASETFTDGFGATRYYTSTKPTLRMNLAPATAQWRVDGGAWQASGAQVTELAVGAHTIDYTEVGGDFNPLPSETISLALRENAVLSRTYPFKPASVAMTISPANAQWILANGPTSTGWQTGNATVSGLTPGNYSIMYSGVSGYDAPPPEAITLAPNQQAALTRSYVAHPAQVTITTTPASGQFRIYPAGGGATIFRDSGTTVTGLAPGNYTVEYAGISGYSAPPAETLTLVAGQSVSFTRNYTEQPARVMLTTEPSTGKWRIYPSGTNSPGGPWNNSGATATGLYSGTYTIEYLALSGYNLPTLTSTTLTAGEYKILTAIYSPLPAQLTVALTPATAQWRLDGGGWNASGATAGNLAAGDHNLEFSSASGYTTPAAQVVTLAAGESKNLSMAYVSENSASITVSITPDSGQWRVDGGAWQASGATAGSLAAGSHTVEFSHVAGYATPAPVSVTLATNENRTLTQTHYPGNASINITLANNIGRWRIDGWVWTNSGWSWYGGSGTHTIEYEAVPGYATPPTESVLVDADQNLVLSRGYTPLPQGTLKVNLTPTAGQWRIYPAGAPAAGAWNAAGASLAGIEPGNYTIEYAPVANYNTPANETVSLGAYQSLTLDRTYGAQAGQLFIHVAPGTVMTDGFPQFRAYQYSTYSYAWYFAGAPVTLAAGEYDIDFAQGSTGWQEPPGFHVTVTAGQTTEVTAQYRYKHYLRFYLNENLIGSMPATEVQRRITQYAADLRTIFARETRRNLEFVYPEYTVIPCTASPFTNTGVLPRMGYDVWLYADLTDQPGIGSYGGSPGINTTQAMFGAGGADNLKWDKIHDPSALAEGSADLEQYWRQIHGIVRQLENLFGAGRGGYDSLAGMSDASGVAPVLATTGPADTFSIDSFWAARPALWADPLTANSYANPRVGSPSSLPALLDSVMFAPVTKAVINGIYHRDQDQPATLPDLSSVVVKVIDAQTRAPISGATVRVWNRSSPLAPYDTFEETVTASAPAGTFTFAWTGAPNPLNEAQNAKIVKASAPGHAPAGGWITVYDAQKARVVDGQTVFEVTLQLTAQ